MVSRVTQFLTVGGILIGLLTMAMDRPPVDGIHPWDFPGVQGRRFPIVANSIIRAIRNAQGQRDTPGSDTLYHFLNEARKGNFTIVRLDVTPSTQGSKSDPFYQNIIGAVSRLNDQHPTQQLSLLVNDKRMRKGADDSLQVRFGELYARREVYGLSVDEPRESEFSSLSKWSRFFSSSDSHPWSQNKLFYVNLFGGQAKKDYVNYVQQWIEIGQPRVLSFDHYAVWDDQRAATFGDAIGADWGRDYFFNLEVFRQASLQTSVPFWTWILVHQHWSQYSKRYYRRATPADLRYEVYSSLAYGAKGILYYNFWNPSPQPNQDGWHQEFGILDYNAQESNLFAAIADLNAEVLALGDLILTLRVVGAYHVTNNYPPVDSQPLEELYVPNSLSPQNQYGIKLVSGNDDSSLSPEEAEYKVVSSMGENPAGMVTILRGEKREDLYLFIVNKNRHGHETFQLTLDEHKLQSFFPAVVVRDIRSSAIIPITHQSQGRLTFSIELEAGDGALLELQRP